MNMSIHRLENIMKLEREAIMVRPDLHIQTQNVFVNLSESHFSLRHPINGMTSAYWLNFRPFLEMELQTSEFTRKPQDLFRRAHTHAV